MRRIAISLLTAAFTALAVLTVVAPTLRAESKDSAARAKSVSKMPHRVVIQVSEDDPKIMNVALNNAENLTKYYQDHGETVQIEFVAYGPGLAMMRSDTSPVKSHLESVAANLKNVSFSGCGNTLDAQSAKENKQISLLPQAHVVAAGIVRIVELQEQGWTYVRP
jgi:uncharacterized protein